MSQIRVADFIAQFISEELGVTDVFMVTGAGIMHLTDGVACNPELRAVCVHHEQSAAMALEAYSRASENFGVGYFSTGPGALNAITGLGGAWQDSVPCLFISGQVKRSEASHTSGVPGLRQFGVQEIDVMPVVQSLCKYAVHLNDAMSVRYELEKCVHLARQGRPGPTWLEVPLDVQSATVEIDDLIGFDSTESKPEAELSQIQAVVESLAQASRPVIIAGQGVRLAGAQGVLEDMARSHSIPVVTPYLGIDVISHASPVYVGKTGVKGDRAANLAMQNSDLVLSIGSSLHVSVIGYEYSQFAREAKKIVVDIDRTAHLKKTIEIDHLIESDAATFLDSLVPLLPSETQTRDWLATCQKWADSYPVCLPEYAEGDASINIYSLVDRLSELSSENDVFIADAGSAFYAVSQGIRLEKDGQRYIPSGAMATMGYSLPAAIGASAATGNKRVLAITGDGSLQQNIQELATIHHYGFPVKIFVLNNNGYLSIRASQTNYFEERFIGESPDSGVWLPDAVRLAEAFGIAASQVSDLAQLDDSIHTALDHPGPYLLDVVTPPDQPVVPTVGSVLNPDGSMSSRPLEDMVPFLDRDEYRRNLLVTPVD